MTFGTADKQRRIGRWEQCRGRARKLRIIFLWERSSGLEMQTYNCKQWKTSSVVCQDQKSKAHTFRRPKFVSLPFFGLFSSPSQTRKGKWRAWSCPLLQLFSLPFPSKMMKEVFGRIGKHYSPTISYLFPRSRTFFSTRVSLLSRVRVRTVDNTRTGLFFRWHFPDYFFLRRLSFTFCSSCDVCFPSQSIPHLPSQMQERLCVCLSAVVM